MHTRIAEIHSYFQHNDHSLAVRRILDASLDTADGALLKEAIQVSQTYRQYKQTELPAAFYESAHNLLNNSMRLRSGLLMGPTMGLMSRNIFCMQK